MTNNYDYSKLPKWAQARLHALERDLESANTKLNAGPDNSDTFADPYFRDSCRPLGKGTMVRFGGEGYDGTYDVSARDGDLHIQVNSAGFSTTPAVLAKASNSFVIRLISRNEEKEGAKNG